MIIIYYRKTIYYRDIFIYLEKRIDVFLLDTWILLSIYRFR